MRNDNGHMDLSIPTAIVAVLAIIVLNQFWDDLTVWARAVAIVLIIGLAVFAARLLRAPAWPAMRADEFDDHAPSDDDGPPDSTKRGKP